MEVMVAYSKSIFYTLGVTEGNHETVCHNSWLWLRNWTLELLNTSRSCSSLESMPSNYFKLVSAGVFHAVHK
jgi:hypothetical protein